MRLLPALVGAAALLGPSTARAADGDGVYGRLDGDLELRAQAGAAFAQGGPALAAGVSAVYLSTAGVYAHYTDALGASAPRVTRSISAGVHLQPLFLARYASNAERGPAFVDLVIDSFAFELGAAWAAPRGAPWISRPGIELALGLAFPLIARSTGPFLGLRGAARWRADDFTPGVPGVIERGAVLSLTLGWHHAVRSHIVDAGDRRPR